MPPRSFFPFLAPALLGALLLAACATPAAKGPTPSDTASTADDVRMGARYFGYGRQADGGDWEADMAVTAYVAGVGGRLAAVAERPDLPFAFAVLDASQPDLWALPGGKVAVTRGLLTRLSSEAELAAVLAHGIVHASETGSARDMEAEIRHRLRNAGLALPTLQAGHGVPVQDVVVGDARVGVALPQRRFDADQEADADRAAMALMARAGYDPAVYPPLLTRIADEAQEDPATWEALTAAHPVSADRAAAARKALAKLATGGETGADAYLKATAPLRAAAQGDAPLAEGRKMLEAGDAEGAADKAAEARAAAPGEAAPFLLEARARMAQERWADARDALDQAVARKPGYYRPRQLRGLVRKELGDDAGAREDLEKALALLPTVAGHAALGNLELKAGETESALYHLRQAAGGGGDEGRQAAETLTRTEIGTVPGRYVAVGAGIRDDGNVFLVLQNRSPLPLRNVTVTVSAADAVTGAVHTATFTFPGPFAPASRDERETTFGPLAPEASATLRVQVTGAELAD